MNKMMHIQEACFDSKGRYVTFPAENSTCSKVAVKLFSKTTSKHKAILNTSLSFKLGTKRNFTTGSQANDCISSVRCLQLLNCNIFYVYLGVEFKDNNS